MIAALAADLTSVTAPLFRTCVVADFVALPSGPLGIDLVLDLDLFFAGDVGAGTGPPVDDDGSGFFFTSVDAELEGRLGLTGDQVLDCECRKDEPAAAPWGPPSVRRVRDCESLHKIAGTCESPGSRLGVTFSPGTSHESLISSRSLALSVFGCVAQFLPCSQRRSNASTSLSSSGTRENGHKDESAWVGAGELPTRGVGTLWPGAAAATATIGAVLGGASTQGGTDAATVGRTNGGE